MNRKEQLSKLTVLFSLSALGLLFYQLVQNIRYDFLFLFLREILQQQIQQNDLFNKQIFNIAKNQLINLLEVIEKFVSNSNSGLNFYNSNFINEFSNIVSSYLDWFNSLPLQNQFALLHVLATFSIFMSLLSLISVYFSEFIFTKLKISEKLKNYPKFLRFFELRRKFQTFYFFTSTIIILILLFTIFFLNLYLLSL